MTLLHLAAQYSSSSVVKVILKSGADADVCDDDKRTPLHYAAQYNDVDVVKTLVDCGSDVSALDKDGQTVLHLAAQNSNVSVLNFLVDSGADVNVCDVDRCTPLHYAAHYNDFDVVRTLVDCGADVSAVDKDARSVLHFAAEKNNEVNVVKMLIDHDSVDQDQLKMLTIAAVVSLSNTSVVKMLIQKTGSIQDGDIQKVAVNSKPAVNFLKLLIERTVNIKDPELREFLQVVKSGSGLDRLEALLFLAVRCKQSAKIVSSLINIGADVDARDDDERTPLIIAAMFNPSMVATLIAHKANVHLVDKYQQSSLHHAAMMNHVEAINALLKAGANVNQPDMDQCSPLHHAALFDQADAINALLKAGAYLCQPVRPLSIHIDQQSKQ